MRGYIRLSTDYANDTARIEISVSYTLGEYRRVLRELVAADFAPASAPSGWARLWNGPAAGNVVFAIVVPLIFAWKQVRIGDCTFAFDAAGFSRTTRRGTASRAWSQVARVRRFSQAYLVELQAGGALPLPFRAFSAAQRTRFDALLQRAGL